ncbi:MAG TPA: sulfatase-like hydrolase/transferase [Thermoanaerobaculia bacterium]|nr:sulfatase-like hydrolase/transferase [Thermoanaerobaculia bacterium]
MRRALLFSALLPLLLSCRPAAERAASQYPGAPVIMISIDTLRADRLPVYGYDRVATPHLDRFRGDSILFENAYTHVPLTLPAHVSLLTGLLPNEHNVRNNIGYVLAEEVPTLPRMLRARGYATGAAVSAYVLRGSTGLSRDFDAYDDAIASRGQMAIGQLQRSGRVTAEIAWQWVEPRASTPFFYLFHIFEPHAPYEPEEPFRSRYRDRYDGEVATADAIVGEFLDRLRASGVYDRAIIIVLSDHGEGLGDHGEPEHGIFLYREVIRIPLLLKLPAGARRGETVAAPVGLVDVMPTVAALTGMTPPTGVRGRSLLDEADPQRQMYSESLYPRIHLGWSELRSLAGSRYQYIEAPRPELYDIAGDPRQRKNVIDAQRRVAADMRAELARYGREVSIPRSVDPEEAKKLAALGYLASPAAAGEGPLPDPKDRIGEIGEMIRASALLRGRRWDEAAAAFRKIVEKNPRLSDGWNQLGQSLESAGRDEEAAEVYRRAIEVAPELAGDLGLRRGAVLMRLEQFEEAERHARLAEATNRGAMYVLLARIELARKNYGAAEAQARAAANDPSYRVAGQLILAQVLAQQERPMEALPIVEQAGLEIEQEGLAPFDSYELIRGDVLARLERYEEAIAAFRREIEHFPANRQAYANLYLVYMVLDRPAEARRALEAMVSANPDRRAILFAARTAETLGDMPAAERWRRRAESAK